MGFIPHLKILCTFKYFIPPQKIYFIQLSRNKIFQITSSITSLRKKIHTNLFSLLSWKIFKTQPFMAAMTDLFISFFLCAGEREINVHKNSKIKEAHGDGEYEKRALMRLCLFIYISYMCIWGKHFAYNKKLCLLF